MSASWTPKPRTDSTVSQWPKAVGSLPAQPHSLPSKNTESLGAYTYYSQGNPGSYHTQGQKPVVTGLAATYRQMTQPRPRPQTRPTTPPVYQPVTPPSSPPSSPPRLLSTAPPVPVTIQRPPQQREIKSPPVAANLSRSRVSPSSSTRPTSPRCICHREHSKIMCYVCGKTGTGRVRMQCPDHPNTIHLMDYDRCPDCKAVNLTEIRTRPH